MSRRILLAFLIPFLASTAHGADDTLYEFKQHLKEGQECAFLLSESFTVSGEFKVNGNVVGRMTRDGASQSKGRIKVLKSDNGVPIAEELEIDKTSGWVFQKTGEAVKQQPFILSGKTVTARRDPFGGITCDFDGAKDPKDAHLLRSWFNRDTDFYPDHPVRIGDKWEVTAKLHRHLGTLTVDDQIVAVSKLVSVHRSAHGHDLARVNISIAMMSKSKDGMLIDGTLDGQAQIDLGSGRVLRFDLAGPVEGSGAMDVVGRYGSHIVAAFAGAGTFEVHQLCRPIASTSPQSQPSQDITANSAADPN